MSRSPGWPQACSVTEDEIKLLVILPLPLSAGIIDCAITLIFQDWNVRPASMKTKELPER